MSASFMSILFTCLILTASCRPESSSENTYSDPAENEYEDHPGEPDDATSVMLAGKEPIEVNEDTTENDNTHKIGDTVCNRNKHAVKTRDAYKNTLENSEDDNFEEDVGQSGTKTTTKVNENENEAKNIYCESSSESISDTPRTKSSGNEKNNNKNEDESIINSDIVDDEKIIKDQIKQLNNYELDELLNSLSNEKRELLERIIDSSIDDYGLHKRDINKKSQAARKLQESAEKVINSGSRSTVKSTDIVSAKKKNARDISKGHTIAANSNIPSLNVDKGFNQGDANVKETSKAQNNEIGNSYEYPTKDDMKRDIDKENNTLNESDDEYSEEDPCSSILDDIKKENKRDVERENDNLSESLNSLADSFQNSYVDTDVDSELTPHVRVKRKHGNMKADKKRGTYLHDKILPRVPHGERNIVDRKGIKEHENLPYETD